MANQADLGNTQKKTGMLTRDSGKEKDHMERVNKSLLMVQYTKVISSMD